MKYKHIVWIKINKWTLRSKYMYKQKEFMYKNKWSIVNGKYLSWILLRYRIRLFCSSLYQDSHLEIKCAPDYLC